MLRQITIAVIAVALLALAGCGSDGESTLRVSGSTTVNPVATDAAAALKGTLKVSVDTQGGSAGGIAQLAAGQVDIAMSSKEVGADDRKRFSAVDFDATQIGADAVGIVVRREVVDGGLESVTRAQLRRLFEGRVQNWKQLGGPDLEVFVYDKEPGRGTREVLDRFLYDEDAKAPPPPDSPRYAIVGGNEETRSKLISTKGSVGPLSSAFVTGVEELVLLAVDGVAPTPESIEDDSYPLARPLFLITDGPPADASQRFINYVLSTPGQKLVTKHGYVTIDELDG
ncbi:MAG: phosphate ABC transporter substrate-binding protein [Solirubrobacteraceae bacterium]